MICVVWPLPYSSLFHMLSHIFSLLTYYFISAMYCPIWQIPQHRGNYFGSVRVEDCNLIREQLRSFICSSAARDCDLLAGVGVGNVQLCAAAVLLFRLVDAAESNFRPPSFWCFVVSDARRREISDFVVPWRISHNALSRSVPGTAATRRQNAGVFFMT
jgi:hypothetical protein